MLNLKAYMDDSGKLDVPGETICCLAGCVSSEDAFVLAQSEWSAVLQKYNVPYLHMRECAHFAGPYKEWKSDLTKRDDFLCQLMDIMEEHLMAVVGSTVPVQDFINLPESYRSQLIDPYFMCFQQSLLGASVIAWTDREQIELIVSDQAGVKGKATKLLQCIRETWHTGNAIKSLKWESHQGIAALQMADLIAYELRRFASDLIKKESTYMRIPMKRLFQMQNFFTFFSENEIIKRFHIPPGYHFTT